ncbi:MAG: sigma-54 dependent transcriptional regulator [Pseudomonadota bacterium]
MKSVLVATQDQASAEVIRGCLAKEFKVITVGDPVSCLEAFRRKRHEFTFIDVSFLRADASRGVKNNFKEALQPFWHAFPTAHIVVMSPQDRIREAVAAVKAGASNYLTYPLSSQEVAYVIESLSEMQKIEHELNHLRESSWRIDIQEGARTNSRLMKDILGRIRSAAQTKTTVLLTGETGVGKGVMARLIHNYSNRSDGPFIAVHCGAIPETLLESELFGHEKGAFTGAVRRKMGKFQIAGGGTIFLDEIGTMTISAQVRLLQVLQDKSFTMVGGESPTEVDVRVVAATNMDLKKLCQEGKFREDLYYRLNVFPAEIPPLRNRIEDLPILVETIIERLNRTHNKDIKDIDEEVMLVLAKYSWPGNIRELENLIERAYILESGSFLRAEGFPSELFAFESLGGGKTSQDVPSLAEVRRLALEQVEKRYLREVLSLNKGRIDQTAAAAGVTTRQLHNLLTKYGLRKEEFR